MKASLYCWLGYGSLRLHIKQFSVRAKGVKAAPLLARPWNAAMQQAIQLFLRVSLATRP